MSSLRRSLCASLLYVSTAVLLSAHPGHGSHDLTSSLLHGAELPIVAAAVVAALLVWQVRRPAAQRKRHTRD